MRIRPVIRVIIVSSLLLCGRTNAQETQTANPNPALVKTYTASRALDLSKEVAGFVIGLIHTNAAGVQDQYRKLTAKTEEEAGGRYATRRFEGLQWFVNEFEHEVTAEGMSESADYIYLARQQLVFGYHHGYSVPVNVVAQVRVRTERKSSRTDEPTKPDSVQPGTKITLTFEGFLNAVPVEQKD